jgi:bifunctional lysine-specific demethylase and histidyl-hydroxylase NO66
MVNTASSTGVEAPTWSARQTPRRQAAYTFEETIAPLTLDAFFRDVWQQKPAVFRNPGGRDFSRVFPMEAVDRLLAGTALRGTDVMLVRDGVYPARQSYTTTDTWADASYAYSTVVDAAKVYEQYDQGHSIILHAIHRSWLPFAHYCREIEATLQCSVSGAALLSPPNLDPDNSHQGPRVHYDVNDHLIVQVSGTKLWRFYDQPFPLPLSNQPQSVTKVRGGACSQELTLSPGDALYFPGGYMHDAIATSEHSLHLPISLVAYRWHDALSRALQALEMDERFRRTIPPALLSDEGFPAFSEQVEAMARLALEQLSPGAVFQSLRRSLMEERRPLLDGALLDRVRLGQVDAETVVRHRAGVFGEIHERDDGVVLRLGRKEIAEPDLDLATLHFIESTPRFRVADLPGPFDSARKVDLVTRLIRAGYLELADGPRAPRD